MPRTTKSPTTRAAGPRLVATSAVKTARPATAMQEAIELRAYELFLQDGGVHGLDVAHWLTAEREVLESAIPAPSARRVAASRAKG